MAGSKLERVLEERQSRQQWTRSIAAWMNVIVSMPTKNHEWPSENQKAGSNEVLLFVEGPTCFYCLRLANGRRPSLKICCCQFSMGGYESRWIVFVSGHRTDSRVGEVSLGAEMLVLDVSKPQETDSISKRCIGNQGTSVFLLSSNSDYVFEVDCRICFVSIAES